MNILIYAGHPAQYHFFKNIIRILKSNGHAVLLLIKTKDVLEELVIHDGFDYINIQPIARKNNPFSILMASFIRTWKVMRLAIKHKTDVLIGTDSSIAQAGFLTRKHAITTLEDDYDVISRLADLSYPYTKTILVPTACSVGQWESKKIGYEGYMKLAYLHPNRFTPDVEIKNKYIQTDKYCILRLAQLTAHHDVGMKGLNAILVNNLIQIILTKGFQVFISSEAEIDEGLLHYQLKINHHDMHHVLAFATLLISDSQSMSVEAAMLGVPSIRYSDFAGRISVLEELEQKYHLTYGVKTSEKARLLKLTTSLLANAEIGNQFQGYRRKMLDEQVDVTAFMVWFVEHYPESIDIMKENPAFQYQFK